jgi:hypothetical protein
MSVLCDRDARSKLLDPNQRRYRSRCIEVGELPRFDLVSTVPFYFSWRLGRGYPIDSRLKTVHVDRFSNTGIVGFHSSIQSTAGISTKN